MTQYVVEKRVILDARHKPTGRTRHFDGGLLADFVSLAIVRFGDADGVYLLYFDADGREMTDTFHATIEEAMAQAQWEFGVEDGNWASNS